MNNKKDLGFILTPKNTAIYIISKLGEIKEEQTILDPCVGPGIFIECLLERGIKRNQIFCYDINPNFRRDLKKFGINMKIQDTLLSINQESYNKFDFIVGNPPYLNKASNYIRQNKKKLKKIYGKINAHETYAMFIVNSIWRLKEGGKLGFITSDSFLTLKTHAKLRKFILDKCLINEILLAPKDLFQNQNVNTSPAIIILTKCSGENNKKHREKNIVRFIPRIKHENEYFKPKVIHKIQQKKYTSLPFYLFFFDVEPQIIDLFEKALKLEKIVKGYIGMHTHNNQKYIAAVEGTELAEIFGRRNNKFQETKKKFKIISREELNSNSWKPYLKRGGNAQYYRPIMEAVDWNPDSISVYDIPKNVPFEKEGIVISGVSSRLAARYMPKGCYWDSNKAIGFTIIDNEISLEYILGLLNSSLYNYLAKGIINNTSSIQITGIHSLPFIKPNIETKEKVEQLVRKIIEKKKKNLNNTYIKEQKEIDKIIFNFYAEKFHFPKELKRKLDEKFSIYQKI
ncbi:MAG: Eco57I restriction-modification methylase domain-containing protein [Promethearchaeota archaeon]